MHCFVFQQLVYQLDLCIVVRFIRLEILKKISGMERAKHARTRPGFQPPHLFVIGKAVHPCPPHFNQWILIGKEPLPALFCPVVFIGHNAQVHRMGVDIIRLCPFPGLVAEQFRPHKPFYHFDFIVTGTLPRHFSRLSAFAVEAPEWDGRNTASAESLYKVMVKIGS